MFRKINNFLNNLEIDSIAFETGFCKRIPQKITPSNFLLSFFLCFRNAHFSLRNWSVQLSYIIGKPVSFQAIDKKIQFQKVDFVKELFSKACKLNLSGKNSIIKGCLAPFSRVLIQDSTIVKLPDKHHGYSSGVFNGRIKKALTRIQCCFDLVSGEIIETAMCTYSENDTAYSSSIIPLLKKGDLLLRDLGYFHIGVFKLIERAGAYFISKLKGNVSIYTLNDEHRIDLVKFLKGLDRKSISSFDLSVRIGAKELLPVRLCGYKLTQEQAMKKRKQLKSSRHKTIRITTKAIYLSNWAIYITNIEKESLTVDQIRETYSLRWTIEMMFKLWKSHLKMNQLIFCSKTPNPARPQMLLYLMLLYVVVVIKPNYQQMAKTMKNKFNATLSLVKFTNFLNNQIHPRLNLKSDLNILLMKKTCCYDQRSDRINSVQTFNKLIFLG